MATAQWIRPAVSPGTFCALCTDISSFKADLAIAAYRIALREDLETLSLTVNELATMLHRGDSVPDPGPDTVLPAGAQVVAVGTPAAVEQLAELLGA